MRVRVLISNGTLGFTDVGTIMDLPETPAKLLINQGIVEPVKKAPRPGKKKK